MNSYFFIPATKLHKIPFVKNLGVDVIIIDFEDSINPEHRADCLKELDSIENIGEFWYRIPVVNSLSLLDIVFINQFIRRDLRNFIIPKLYSYDMLVMLDKSLNSIPDKLNIIILVEHPRLLIELKEVLIHPYTNIQIHGIGLGSHDITEVMQINHDIESIKFLRENILIHAKAYNIKSIDIASMNISQELNFKKEMQLALDLGYDAKFLIHPKQLTWFKNINNISEEKYKWARNITDNLPPDVDVESIEPFQLNGEIIERMHIKKAYKIIKQYHGK